MSKKWCQEPLIAQEAPAPTARELSGLMERWTGSWVKEWFLTPLSSRHRCFQHHAEARYAIAEYIEVFYNRQRLHQALGYRSPEEFERQESRA